MVRLTSLLGSLREARRQNVAAGVLAVMIGFAATLQQRPVPAQREFILPVVRAVRATPEELAVHERSPPALAVSEPVVAEGEQEVIDAALEHPNPAVRAEAVFALGEIGGANSVQIAGRALNDRDIAVRTAAIDALRVLGTAEGMEYLLQALADAHPRVRQAASNALEDLREGQWPSR